ncbi:MAG: 5-formyltetrahydrofolate cyclo-ligase [Limnobacter sp.]|nr:5-formyltetrahydrofolate cyclo-ligase [Limnobacter sp.]
MKKNLRQQIQARRAQLTEGDIRRSSLKLVGLVDTLLHSQGPCTVAIYHPFRNEPNLLSLLSNPDLRGFQWALPVCNEGNTEGGLGGSADAFLDFALFSKDSALQTGKYGIPVPVSPVMVKPDVMLIPCLGFHREGARLGYGAGWYDRTLSRMVVKPFTVGICFAEDEIADSFTEAHDHILDAIVTPQEIIVV